ncbi:MAG: sulfatase [Verrucomicrobiota bacterium]
MINRQRPAFLLLSLALLCATALTAAPAPRPNVLFIAADDLRTDLGSYGSTEAKTPNLDALARRGVLFERAYCQQAVCNPSRASIMTGRRPDTLKVWDLRTHFRQALPEVVTLPQHFKQHGYTAIDIGKIFHNESGTKPPIPFCDPRSWSEPPLFAEGAHWQDDPTNPKAKGGAMQRLDVPDEAYFDGKIATAACEKLRVLAAKRDQPFFLAVGFWKPHLPFNAPKKYWDLYDRAKLKPPGFTRMPEGAPPIAGHPSKEVRGYGGVPEEGPLSPELIAELRHGYLAGVSFLDAQVGRVIGELDRLGLAKNTVIVFWSDHGFHLGEHDLWAKTSNYELDTRVPLLVAAPGIAGGGRAMGLVELLDVYPTLADLCGLPAAMGVEGESFAPLLRDPKRAGKPIAISQHPHPSYGKATHMGYTVRTPQLRYVEWRDLTTGALFARELYDHKADPAETVNRVNDSRYASDVKSLGGQVQEIAAASGRWPAIKAGGR